MPVVGLEAWFTQIPPVTRTWLALSVLTSVAVVRPCEFLFPGPPGRSFFPDAHLQLLTSSLSSSYTAMSTGNSAAAVL